MTTYILILIGAINWGLVGIGWFVGINLNLVDLIFGSWPILENLVYLVVGISGAIMLFQRSCDYCGENK